MKKKLLIGIIFIIIAGLVIKFNFFNSESESQEYLNKQEIQNEEVQDIPNIEKSEPTKTVEEIKTEIGSSASDNIYEVKKEYDGREVLSIKPDIQFKTVLAGVLKNGKPSENDVNKLDISSYHNGVWISEVSRNKFLNILKKCGINNFDIDENGYLYQKEKSENQYSTKLQQLINANELTIIDITGTCYIRDDMTGDIVEYPFKDMDLYQICEIYETEGSKIFIITTNDVDKNDIIKTICE